MSDSYKINLIAALLMEDPNHSLHIKDTRFLCRDFFEQIDNLSNQTIDLAQRILNGTAKRYSNGSLDEPYVMYDADFYPDKSQPAVFINIKNKLPGSRLGFLAFLDFLWIAEEHSQDRSFLSTSRTVDGEKLFKRMQQLGLIAAKNNQKAMGYDLWKIVGNPEKHIRQIASMPTK